MSEPVVKEPKKKKGKNRYDRKADFEYNKLLYGPLSCEASRQPRKKVNYGKAYIDHPNWPQLLNAFKQLLPYKFDIQVLDKLATISCDGHFIKYNDIPVCYSRISNRYEDLLLFEKTSLAKQGLNPGFVHLVFAVISSFPDLDNKIVYTEKRFYFEGEFIDKCTEEELQANILVGHIKHQRFEERHKNYKRG